MNKAEALTDLQSRIIKVIKEYEPVVLNGSDREYSFLCVVDTNRGFYEENYSIRVIDEGLPTEKAGYVNGKQPPDKSDLEIGLALLLAEDQQAKVLSQVSDKVFKVRLSTGPVCLVTLNSSKDKLLFAPSE